MQKHGLRGMLIGLVVIGFGSFSYADGSPSICEVLCSTNGNGLSICQVQCNTNGDGRSDYDDDVIDCAGGIVVGKWQGWGPGRVILQDPANSNGWGGIQVKDWTSDPLELYDAVELGDWVELTQVWVQESVGTTILHWEHSLHPGSGFNVTTHGLPLPPPVIVSVADIPAPIEHPGDEWYVENHDAELYESMRLVVRDVTVTEKLLGSHEDNYNLHNSNGDCWAADYMNEDRNSETGYHEFVEEEQHFCAVAGLFEQYTDLEGGYDHYQLITMKTVDLAICGDGDSDGDVDVEDHPRFEECLIGPLCDDAAGGCIPPAWTWPTVTDLPVQHCLMMDSDCDGDVDLADFGGFQTVFGVPQPWME